MEDKNKDNGNRSLRKQQTDEKKNGTEREKRFLCY